MRIAFLAVPWLFMASCVTTLLAGDFALPEGDGKTAVASACSGCHTLEILEGKRWSKLRWQAVVNGMSAKIPNEPISTANSNKIVEYLAKNFGEDRGQRLVEDICSLCHEWQRVQDYPKTREQWTGTIKGMIFEGAPVTDEEFKLIVDYLAKNYGPPKDEK